jgi:hypothetical protein
MSVRLQLGGGDIYAYEVSLGFGTYHTGPGPHCAYIVFPQALCAAVALCISVIQDSVLQHLREPHSEEVADASRAKGIAFVHRPPRRSSLSSSSSSNTSSASTPEPHPSVPSQRFSGSVLASTATLPSASVVSLADRLSADRPSPDQEAPPLILPPPRPDSDATESAPPAASPPASSPQPRPRVATAAAESLRCSNVDDAPPPAAVADDSEVCRMGCSV